MATNTVLSPLEAAALAPRSALVGGFNHVASMTPDLDRLVTFYRDMFDVPFTPVPGPPGHEEVRHGFFHFGPGTPQGDMGPMLHVFELGEEVTGALPDATTMFRRGRLDHIAIEAADEFALAEIRDRLVAAGHSDGAVRVFGGFNLSVHVEDPDGMQLEVCCRWSGHHFGEDEVVPGHG